MNKPKIKSQVDSSIKVSITKDLDQEVQSRGEATGQKPGISVHVGVKYFHWRRKWVLENFPKLLDLLRV